MKPWLFLAPSLAGTAMFVLIPFVNVVARSFFQAVGGQFVSMENFTQVFHSQAFRLAVKNTLHFILVCTPVLMAFSLWTAMLVTAAADSRNLYKAAFLLPIAISVASVVLLWKPLPYPQGLLDQLVVWADERGQDWLNQGGALYIPVLVYIRKNTGRDMMLWLVGLDRIPKELLEAVKVDGAGSQQSFFHVAPPGLKGTAFLVLVLFVVNSLKVFREVYPISEDHPHEGIHMLQHLFSHWFVSLNAQKVSVASAMVEISILIPVLPRTWKRKKR